MVQQKLPQWLTRVARQMLMDFEDTSHIQHNLSKGQTREGILLRQALAKYVPRHVLTLGSGEIRSVDEKVSSQQDIMIVDPATPPLYEQDEYRVVPVECLHMVGEVKSILGLRELDEAWSKSHFVKQMPKVAWHQSHSFIVINRGLNAYGRTWPFFPTASFIFAYDSIDLEALGERIYPLSLTTPVEYRVDAIFVLKQGFIIWGDGNLETPQYHFRPRPESTFMAATSTPEGVLMTMMRWINSILADAWMPPFDIGRYMSAAIVSDHARWWVQPEPVIEVTIPIPKPTRGDESAEGSG
jgi:uncharacterized protein DUF6602